MRISLVDIASRVGFPNSLSCLRALVEVEVEPATPVRMAEGDRTVAYHVARAEQLLSTGGEVNRQVARGMPRGWDCYDPGNNLLASFSRSHAVLDDGDG